MERHEEVDLSAKHTLGELLYHGNCLTARFMEEKTTNSASALTSVLPPEQD